MANKYLFDDLLLFESGEGEEATSPSLATENESIDASSSSLEAPIATHHIGGMQTGIVPQRQTNTYFPIFCYLRAKRATRKRHPLLQLKTNRLILPARHWKRSLQLITCREGCKQE